MITVVIPTLNEEDHIASVVQFAFTQPHVTEVLVVDDKSQDNTITIARNHGAKIITSSKLGKGAPMKEGVQLAMNDIIVFLDGDIDPYPHFTIRLLTEPILSGEADFVKSAFNRNAGRVTELVAKPLLSIFFPDLLRYQQPLSGMIAGKKSVFQQIDFRQDYGVDIGILIDMHLLNVRMKEVEIGYIENKSKAWHALGKMSKEVAQTIIMKASSSNNPRFNLEEMGVLSQIRSQMEFALDNQLNKLSKLIIFDMDNTLLQGRFIDECATRFEFRKELLNIRSTESNEIVRTKQIAKLLRGISYTDLISVIDSIPIIKGTAEIIASLKERGYLVGIISDSYDCITNHVRTQLGMDFSLANELEFSQSVCTGEVKLPSFLFNHPDSICRHAICKTNAMQSVLTKYNIQRENAITIGDSQNDICMIKEAGLGISFRSKDELVNHHADVIITGPTFNELLELTK